MQVMSDIQNVGNLREKCKYFPCHDLAKESFDCRTCYCPIYEECFKQKNPIFGGYVLDNGIWACEKCSFIHRKEIVEKIIDLQEQNKTEEEIYFALVNFKLDNQLQFEV